MLHQEKFPNQRNEYSISDEVSTTPPSLLKRTTDILSCLSDGIDSATEIAAYCHYSVSTVHRLLQNLSRLGWVVQDRSNHRYFLGPLIFRLTIDRKAAHKFLILHALKEMYRLSDLTEETINLGIFENLLIRKAHDIPSKHNLRIIEEADKYRGLYLGATAKVLLSQLTDDELDQTLKHLKLERITESSVVDTVILREQIEAIRNRHYSVSFGERIVGAVCISAPILHYHYPVALSIVGPETRLGPILETCIKEIKSSTQRISGDIAGVFNT